MLYKIIVLLIALMFTGCVTEATDETVNDPANPNATKRVLKASVNLDSLLVTGFYESKAGFMNLECENRTNVWTIGPLVKICAFKVVGKDVFDEMASVNNTVYSESEWYYTKQLTIPDMMVIDSMYTFDVIQAEPFFIGNKNTSKVAIPIVFNVALKPTTLTGFKACLTLSVEKRNQSTVEYLTEYTVCDDKGIVQIKKADVTWLRRI